MNHGFSWIAEAKLHPLPEIVQRLGMDLHRDRCGPCPACGDTHERGVRRLPVGLMRGNQHWICNHCRVSGNGLDLVAWKILGKPCRGLDREGWGAIRDWFGAGQNIFPSPNGLREGGESAPPDYPPHQEIAALWASLTPLEGPSTPAQQSVIRWLQGRGLSPDRVRALDGVRCGPVARPPRLPEGERAVRCPGWPWCAVLPLFDATGLLRSLIFRAVEPPQVGPKSYALAGYERRGLVLANPMGRALLSHGGAATVLEGEGGPRVKWDGVVRLVEGEPDFLTWASDPERLQRETGEYRTAAVFGWFGSAGLPLEVARRIPSDARVVLYPHQDTAGEKAALLSRQRLAHIYDVRKGKV